MIHPNYNISEKMRQETFPMGNAVSVMLRRKVFFYKNKTN